MTNSWTLTPNAVHQLLTTQRTIPDAVFQVLSCKKLQPNPGAAATAAERYRIILSDGTHFMQGMLATQLNSLVSEGKVDRDTVIVAKNYVLNHVQSRRIMILLDVEVLGNPGHRIGTPTNFEPSAMTDSSAPVLAAPPQPIQHHQNQPMQQHQNQPLQQHQNQSMPGPMDGSVHPIKSLNPYMNRWTIKARAIDKGDIRHWSNAKGEGKLFNVTFIDESGEIKANGFNDAVDRFYNLIENNKVYYVSKASIKPARKGFSNVQNDYELSFDQNTEITPCNEPVNLPSVRFNFVQIVQLTDYPKDSIVDIIGVVQDAGEIQQLTSKQTNRQLTKRDLTLVDQSLTTVKLTLWGQSAETFDATGHPVAAFKGVRVSDYGGGRSLSALNSTSISLNPDVREAHLLRGWFDQQGSNLVSRSISGGAGSGASGARSDERICLAQIVENNLGHQEKPDYFAVKATTMKLNPEKTMWYDACPSENCNKKVILEGANSWRCEKCQRTFPYCDRRYIFTMPVQDHTGTAWFQCFNEIGAQVLGHTAEELHQMKENGNQEALDAVLGEAAGKSFVFRVRAKAEFYNDETRVRTSVMSCEPLDFVKEIQYLASVIEKY